jgi:hypothetical protein
VTGAAIDAVADTLLIMAGDIFVVLRIVAEGATKVPIREAIKEVLNPR